MFGDGVVRPGAGQHAGGFVHGAHPFHRKQDRVEVARVGELELEAEPRDAVGLRLRRARNDVDVMLGEDIRDVTEQTGAVERFDLDRHDVVAGCVVVPLDVDDAIALGPQAQRVRTVGAVHGNTAAPRDEAHDLVAGNRRAAA
jgi:hypothetical protein